MEVFGPTIQGEGPQAGTVTDFVRLAGCDYRCSWCDSMYAVDPAEWSHTADRLDAHGIMDRIAELSSPAQWVTISGGNPGLYHLDLLVDLLHQSGRRVAVETQASRWRPWMTWVDSLVLSPKPPSSGMVTERHQRQWERFLDVCVRTYKQGTGTAMKVVVFDDNDYEWAADLFAATPDRDWWRGLSVGTDPPDGNEVPEERSVEVGVLDRWQWLAEKAAADPRMAGVHVLPQLHVLAWSHARAV